MSCNSNIANSNMSSIQETLKELGKNSSQNNDNKRSVGINLPLQTGSRTPILTISGHDSRINRTQGAIPKRRNFSVDSVGLAAERSLNSRRNLPLRKSDRVDQNKNYRQKARNNSTSRSISMTRKSNYGNGEVVHHNDWKREKPRQINWPNSRASSPGAYSHSGYNSSNKDKVKEKKDFNDKMKEKFNKSKEKKDFSDIPRRMDWMVDFSEKSSLDIVAKLANSHSGFENVIKDVELLQKKPDIIVLVMKMLHKVGDADFKETKGTVLSNACSKVFLEQLKCFMMKLPTNEYKNEAFDINDFLTDVLKFSESIIILMPTVAADLFSGILYMVHMTVLGMETYKKIVIRDDVKELHERLQKLLAKSTEELKEKKVKLTTKAELQSLEAPPNNFRDINLIPTMEDIFTEEVFVRPNLILGAYRSVEHYLDVQFRLLYEDFLHPLREGITEFVKKVETHKIKKSKPITNVRFYPKVVFLRPKVENDRIGIAINFDPQRNFKNMNWRSSKRFMYGSLLCFTQDNFRTSFFGTIVEREVNDLEKGIIVIELCIGSQIRDDLFSEHFAMAESEVYFEPYYQVLKALREITEDDFPMRSYILEAQSEGSAPAYLLTDPPARYIIESDFWELGFPVLSPDLWPTAQQLGLDDSQYKAFQFALTRELVVVQGPPGTGKTFLGLKVAGVMLKNEEIWNADKKPILVVCYTNHALDQFLEGLVKHTNKIVRAGGRSKNENLEMFSLKHLRREWKKGKDMNKRVHHYDPLRVRDNLGRDIHEDMAITALNIKRIQLDLEKIDKNEGIISPEILHERKIIDDHCYKFFQGESHEEKDYWQYVEWLLPQNENVYFPEDEIENNEENDEENVDVKDENDDGRQTISRNQLEGYDLQIKNVESKLTYAISVASLNDLQRKVENDMSELKELKAKNYILYFNHMSYLSHHQSDIKNKRARLLQRLKETNVVKEAAMRRLRERPIEKLNFDERWMLYRYWISQLKDSLLKDFKELEESFKNDAKKYEEVRHMIDLHIMMNASVVGMTTTYAARYQTLLKALKPKIVIVEEAAEVLESHIIVSLTSHCQHLILIGDHQQLRPSTSVYRMAKEYKLDVSLFERMINNGMRCEVLKVQHRMRPEIASLIVPSIYPELNNHEDVTRFEEILGVTKSLFFIDHTYPDEEIGDSFSRKNEHEGQFLIALCKHLVLQGYDANNITVLATYTAQMFYMKNLSKQYELLKDVCITVVDNFQGEESDIILLSLVRSNEDANIGFLKIENRVCVALSRARKGMYIMGNMKNLTESSEIWPKINETLEQLGSIGKGLELQCQVHPNEKRLVSKAEDFLVISEGGCSLICNSLLACGHLCKKMCHASDREHKNYKCPENPCDKVMCILGHKCKKSCFEKCGPCMVIVTRKLLCGHEKDLPCHVNYFEHRCSVIVNKELPACKHENEMQCWMDPLMYPCQVPCTFRLDDCGHTCRLRCHVNKDPDHLDYKCTKPCPLTNAQCSKNHPCTKICYEECGLCEEIVVKESPACGHKNKMPCHQDPITFLCQEKCVRTMACGHKCKKKCFETCNTCNVAVMKTIPDCGHKIQLRCSMQAERSMCSKPCERTMSCGHGCKLECGKPCNQKCEEFVESPFRAECGHVVKLPCYKLREGLKPNSDELLSYCRMDCNTVLKCGHPCKGTCFDCLQGRVHVPCKQDCGRIQICGHKCGTPCAASCPPCNRKCEMRCYHNRCQKKCGQPCTPCTESCGWVCKHYKCTRKCSEPCNRPPCEHPCNKTIKKCNHPCIGFCGEPCPKLCRICDKEEVTTIKLGNEDEEDARFVFLEDCSHIVEARGLEHWLLVDNDRAITIAECPLCKTPITRNRRYSNIIKQRYEAVCEVKRRVFGEKDRISQRRNQYFQNIKKWKGLVDVHSGNLKQMGFGRNLLGDGYNVPPKSILLDSHSFKGLVNFLFDSLDLKSKKNKKNSWSNYDMETLGIETDIVCEMATKVQKYENILKPEAKQTVLKYMEMILRVIRKRGRYLSSEEVDDLNLEVQRFQRIVIMCAIKSMPTFKTYFSTNSKTLFEDKVHIPLLSIKKYSAKQDTYVHDLQNKIIKAIGGLTAITDEERRQIVKAVGMKPGHWFKCPNGHLYIIGECGGANQIGKCNECGTQIGGEDHRLLSTNRHAPEMDGSRFPPWSEAANMENYVL